MKFKKILIAVLFLSIFSISTAYSQRDDKPRKSPEEMATRMADRMKSNLALTDAQYNSVRDIMLNHMNDRQLNKDSWKNLSKEERKSMRQKHREELKSKLSSVLTAEQMRKFGESKKSFKHKGSKERMKQKELR
jgi:Spy/CpxP family protein refolding chaperone